MAAADPQPDRVAALDAKVDVLAAMVGALVEKLSGPAPEPEREPPSPVEAVLSVLVGRSPDNQQPREALAATLGLLHPDAVVEHDALMEWGARGLYRYHRTFCTRLGRAQKVALIESAQAEHVGDAIDMGSDLLKQWGHQDREAYNSAYQGR